MGMTNDEQRVWPLCEISHLLSTFRSEIEKTKGWGESLTIHKFLLLKVLLI